MYLLQLEISGISTWKAVWNIISSKKQQWTVKAHEVRNDCWLDWEAGMLGYTSVMSIPQLHFSEFLNVVEIWDNFLCLYLFCHSICHQVCAYR